MKSKTSWELKLILALLLITGIAFAGAFLFPLFMGFFLYLLLNPLHEWMIYYRMPSWLASALICSFFSSVIVLGIVFLADPASDWIKKAPTLVQTLEQEVKKPLKKIGVDSDVMAKFTDVNEKNSIKISVKTVINAIVNLSSSMIFLLGTIIVLLFFMLTYLKMLIPKIEKFLYKKSEMDEETNIFIHIRNDLSSYLFTFTFICVGLGSVMALVFWILGVPNPLLWGVMVMLLTFIPYFGHFTGIIVIFMVSFLTFDSCSSILLPPLFYLLISILEGQFITPMILGNRLNFNPLIIILNMFFWGWIWGVSGLIISIPILIIFKIILEHIPHLARYKSLFEQ